MIRRQITAKSKIQLARLINRTLKLGRRALGLDMRTVCRRGGLRWDLDLNEGIDLAIFLFRSWERGMRRAYASLLRPGAVVFDIGANIGAHTLPLARLVGASGRVYAFEPTDYAFGKLQRNLALNPELAARVVASQCFLVARDAGRRPDYVFSSWPMTPAANLHREHLGAPKTLTGARTVTADTFCREQHIDRIDFVKLDVDGYELEVLRGFAETLRTLRPLIFIELAPFVHTGETGSFAELVDCVRSLDYGFFQLPDGRALPSAAEELETLISHGSCLNVLLRPTVT